MLNEAEQNTDWKSKYQATLDELDAREREWTEVEDLLRKTIARLSVAGRGIDTRLDKQLRLVHDLTREKRNAQLADALAALSEVMTALDESRGGSLSRRSDPILLMLELLQSIHFDKAQRAQLREICSELLKSVASGQDRERISLYIRQLAALINENFDHPSAGSSVVQIVQSLLDLLHLDPEECNALRNRVIDAAEDEAAVLKDLAEQINRRFEAPAENGSIDEVMNTLLERLAMLQGASGETQKIRERVQDGVGVGEWAATLNEIVGSISTSLERLNREKRELEDFIRNVTAQLGEITEVISLDHQDHRSDHEDAQSLHDFVQQGMRLR